LRNTKPTLLFLGTTQNKNLENCIPAIFNLQVKLRIIGEITPRQELLLNKFDIDYSSVKQISDSELKKEYNNCDIVLFPSVYEGFGLPVIEAFATGKPVITSDISPLNDLAKDAGVYVNPHSITSIRHAVQKLISSPELRIEKVSKGLEVIKAYQVNVVLAKYQDVWEKVENLNSKVS
jgi:glycosyltransferase involved in cell wall biosynthesis